MSEKFKITLVTWIIALVMAGFGMARLANAAIPSGPFDTAKKCVDGPNCAWIDGGACLNFQEDLTRDEACRKLMAINEPVKCPSGTQPCNKCAKNSGQGKCSEIKEGYLPGCKDISYPRGGAWKHMTFGRDNDAHCKVLCCPGSGSSIGI